MVASRRCADALAIVAVVLTASQVYPAPKQREAQIPRDASIALMQSGAQLKKFVLSWRSGIATVIETDPREKLPGFQLDDPPNDDLPKIDIPVVIQVVGSGFNNDIVKRIKPISQIQGISLNGTRITNDGIAEIKKNVPHLRALSIKGSLVDDDIADSIMSLKDLSHLALCRTRVTSNIIQRLIAHPTLTHIVLGDVEVDLNFFKHAAKMKNLKSLSIEEFPVTSDFLVPLSSSGLERLKIDNYMGTSRQLLAIQSLTAICVPYAKMRDEEISKLATTKQLIEIDLSHTSVSNETLANIVINNSKLQSLEASFTNIDDTMIPDLSKAKSLKYVNMKSTKITIEGVRTMRSHMPACVIVH